MSVPTSDPAVASLPRADAASLPRASAYDAQVGEALKGLIDRHGVDIVGHAGRLRGLLQDECPTAKREISVLLQALEQRIPQDLLRVQSGEPIRSLSPRLSRRLVEEKAMSEPASQWAVQTWAHGLGLDDAGAQADRTSAAWPSVEPVPGPFTEDGEFGPAPGPEPMPYPLPRPGPVTRLRPGWIAAGLLAAVAAGGGAHYLQPTLTIQGVEPEGVMVANGKPNPVRLNYRAHRAAPRRIEVRYVRGDGQWPTTPTLIDMGGDAAAGTVPAGTLSLRSGKPVSVTFAYTLISADGRRSEPFERSFDFRPPVVIAAVDVPRQLLVGQDVVLTFHYEKGAADLVSIERRVVRSSEPWETAETALPIRFSGESGSFTYRLHAFTGPRISVLDFTLVDAQGVRSEPYRLTLDVVAPAPAPAAQPPAHAGAPAMTRQTAQAPATTNLRSGTVVQVRELRVSGQASGAGAVAAGVLGGLAGHQGGSRGGVRDILAGLGALGGAVVGNEAEKQLRSRTVWEITVRMDAGGSRALRQDTAPTVRVGDRVQLDADGALVLRR